MKVDEIGFISDPFATPVQFWIRQDVQLPDIVEWVCARFPGAEVRLTTFSVAEESLRRLYFIRSRNVVSRIEIIIDRKATLKTAKLKRFVSQVFDSASLANIHAKMCIFTWPDRSGGLLLVSSQNLTRGGRFESSALVSHPSCVSEALKRWDFIVREKSTPIADLIP